MDGCHWQGALPVAEHAGSAELLGGGQLGAALQFGWHSSQFAIGQHIVTYCLEPRQTTKSQLEWPNGPLHCIVLY